MYELFVGALLAISMKMYEIKLHPNIRQLLMINGLHCRWLILDTPANSAFCRGRYCYLGNVLLVFLPVHQHTFFTHLLWLTKT